MFLDVVVSVRSPLFLEMRLSCGISDSLVGIVNLFVLLYLFGLWGVVGVVWHPVFEVFTVVM